MAASPDKKPGFFKSLFRTFFAGLLAALPLALTVAVVVWLAEFIQRFLGPSSTFGKILGSIGLKFVTSEEVAYLIGVVISISIIYLLGVLVEAGMRSRWQSLIDNLLNRLPLVRTVYNSITKLTKMFELKEETDLKSMSPVMCYFGGKSGGTAVLALLTSPEPIHMNGLDYYSVMIPTAPVPFGGAILYVPVEWVKSADMSFDGLLNVYMSMGVTSAEYLHKKPDQVTPAKTPL
ncbi:MAG: DUF502 domain-containing protein [Gammaproteobacteria bacterium]|jgi:uncharacterized membrane protein